MVRLTRFDIPVLDLERAVEFYTDVFDLDISIRDVRADYGSIIGVMVKDDGVLGTMNANLPHQPSQSEGCIIFFNVNDEDLQITLDRVVKAGGHILLPICKVEPTGKRGYVALIVDTEGNRIGLHSQNSSNTTVFPGDDFTSYIHKKENGVAS
ncbi:MAG: VOC family protein [Chloroflexota bacterium]